LEHIPQHETPLLLEKWYNALKIGGKIRVEVPDLEQLCHDFINGDEKQKMMTTFCIYGAFADYASPEMIANNTASFHVWGFYPDLLKSWFKQLEFRDIKVTLIKDAVVGKNFVIEAIK
jgi:predicted SAM-dependent methyltransferase